MTGREPGLRARPARAAGRGARRDVLQLGDAAGVRARRRRPRDRVRPPRRRRAAPRSLPLGGAQVPPAPGHRRARGAPSRVAILDYGEAIRDLARSNIFPGDMLLKNFGVTRHGRVVFYDYDELARLTDCRFREMPRARYDDEEMSGQPWFFVGENDVFPEEFLPFLGLESEPRRAFLERHSDHGSPSSSPETGRGRGRVTDGGRLPASPGHGRTCPGAGAPPFAPPRAPGSR